MIEVDSSSIPRVPEKLRKKLGLTKRQTVLLEMLRLGHTNIEIAQTLGVTDHTVKVHMFRLFKVIGVSSRLEALRWYNDHTFGPEFQAMRSVMDVLKIALPYLSVSDDKKSLLGALAVEVNKAAELRIELE